MSPVWDNFWRTQDKRCQAALRLETTEWSRGLGSFHGKFNRASTCEHKFPPGAIPEGVNRPGVCGQHKKLCGQCKVLKGVVLFQQCHSYFCLDPLVVVEMNISAYPIVGFGGSHRFVPEDILRFQYWEEIFCHCKVQCTFLCSDAEISTAHSTFGMSALISRFNWFL